MYPIMNGFDFNVGCKVSLKNKSQQGPDVVVVVKVDVIAVDSKFLQT